MKVQNYKSLEVHWSKLCRAKPLCSIVVHTEWTLIMLKAPLLLSFALFGTSVIIRMFVDFLLHIFGLMLDWFCWTVCWHWKSCSLLVSLYNI